MTAALLALVLSCGVERWAEKTLQDGFIPDGGVEPTTIAELSELPALSYWTGVLERQEAERRVVVLEASIVGYKAEEDEDFHVVISDAGKTMIIEFPSPHCAPKLAAARRAFLALVPSEPTPRYRKLRKPIPVRVTGMPFFDRLHGQTGVARNGIELHPVLSITSRTSL